MRHQSVSMINGGVANVPRSTMMIDTRMDHCGHCALYYEYHMALCMIVHGVSRSHPMVAPSAKGYAYYKLLAESPGSIARVHYHNPHERVTRIIHGLEGR